MLKFILIVFCLFLFAGCAFVDQRVTLTYSPINAAKGGHGDLYIAMPVNNLTNKKKDNDLIIGAIKNIYGMKFADVVTNDNISDWVTMAYMMELGYAGYNVKAVNSFPSDLTRGLQITVNELFVEHDQGAITVGAITDLKFSVNVYKNNNKISAFDVDAKGDSRALVGGAKTKSLSLTNALRSAIEKSVPQIIKILE